MKPLKDKKCKCCGVVFIPFKSTQIVCDYKCAIDHTNKMLRSEAKRIARAERKEYYRNNMTLSDWKKKVQTVFNNYIRLRDMQKGCISCGTPLQLRKFDAGHYYPTTYQGIRFHENNVHGQCVPCNRNKHGNIHEYRKRITERISQEELDWLDENRNIKLNLNKIELEELYIKYKKMIKEIKKLN